MFEIEREYLAASEPSLSLLVERIWSEEADSIDVERLPHGCRGRCLERNTSQTGAKTFDGKHSGQWRMISKKCRDTLRNLIG